MNAAELPGWAAVATSLLLLFGAGLTLTGAIGLLRLRSFYERVHAPTLGTTLGAACVLGASTLYFSTLQSRPVLSEILILGFLFVTTPISLLLLVRAALHRDRHEGSSEVPHVELPPSLQAGGEPPSEA